MVVVRWVATSDGGRKHLPSPTGRYSTVARFEALRDLWPHEAWSVILEDAETLASDPPVWRCRVRLLNEGDGPPDLLVAGSRFDLFEGPQLVAHAEVVGDRS